MGTPVAGPINWGWMFFESCGQLILPAPVCSGRELGNLSGTRLAPLAAMQP